jgi:O-methyltransferase
MISGTAINRMLNPLGLHLSRLPPIPDSRPLEPFIDYLADGLRVSDKSCSFLSNERFMSAYRKGANTGHNFGDDLHTEWRVAVGCWVAKHGTHIEGDFVECGVNTGILSVAICNYLNFGSLKKTFYLFDTFRGIPEHQMSEREREPRTRENASYAECYELACRNFSPFANVKLIRGAVPDTLSTVDIDKVAYLSIDMNLTLPEKAAIEHFWPKLSSGAMVVLDDYGWSGYSEQKTMHDKFAAGLGLEIFELPTGQGLLVKP